VVRIFWYCAKRFICLSRCLGILGETKPAPGDQRMGGVLLDETTKHRVRFIVLAVLSKQVRKFELRIPCRHLA
jgi:hypothetical protein